MRVWEAGSDSAGGRCFVEVCLKQYTSEPYLNPE